MKERLLSLLVCPRCKDSFQLSQEKRAQADIESGELKCPNNHTYPIVRGIPRLLSGMNREFQHIHESFSSEWEAVGSDAIAWGQTSEERKSLFLKCCDLAETQLKGKWILDAGCGHGEVEFGLIHTGAEIVAVDLSSSVDQIRDRLERVGASHLDHIHLIQANLHELPLRRESFDIVHSAGVLHHTPDTLKGLKEIATTLKSGGTCFIEVYSTEHKNFLERTQYHLFRMLRQLTLKLPHRALHSLCWSLAPLAWSVVNLHRGLTGSGRYHHRTLREIELSLFDALSPLYDWHHTTSEVVEWFQNLGLGDIRKTFYNHNVIGIVGTRPLATSA